MILDSKGHMHPPGEWNTGCLLPHATGHQGLFQWLLPGVYLVHYC